MKLGRFGLVMGGSAMMVLAIACSSSSSDDSSNPTDSGSGTDTSTGGGDSGTKTDSGGGGSCNNLQDGTYDIAYSGPDGGIGCPPSDTTITIGGGDGGDAGGLPPGCTDNVNSTTCVDTLACDSTTSGYETKINIVVTPNAAGNGATGTYSVVTTEPDGGPFESCTGVTFTYTKE